MGNGLIDNRFRIIMIAGLFMMGVGLFAVLGGFGSGSPDVAEPENGNGNGIIEQQYENENDSYETDEPDESGGMMTEALRQDIEAGYLILVNREHGLASDYAPDDLVGIRYFAPDRSAEARFMRTTAADAFHDLVYAARAEGIEFVMTTAFRSYSLQTILHNNHVANHGQEAADRFSARAGHSEHQTGLAVDISAASVDYRLTVDFANTDEGRWVAQNAYHFGFILRYPDWAEHITGFQFEPWHLRYVGLPAAEYIHANNITLEEYWELLSNLI